MENELPKTKIDERTGIEYHLEGDYYIPNLVMPKQEKITLNKYGRMRLNYLKEHKKADYTIMLMNGTLNAHLKEIQDERYLIFGFMSNRQKEDNKEPEDFDEKRKIGESDDPLSEIIRKDDIEKFVIFITQNNSSLN